MSPRGKYIERQAADWPEIAPDWAERVNVTKSAGRLSFRFEREFATDDSYDLVTVYQECVRADEHSQPYWLPANYRVDIDAYQYPARELAKALLDAAELLDGIGKVAA